MIFKDLRGKAPNYLNSSVCLVKKDNVDLGLYRISLNTDLEGNSELLGVGKDSKVLQITNKTISEFEFLSPTLGWYYDPQNEISAYVERVPFRAWRVGITQNNVSEPIIFRLGHNDLIVGLEKIWKREYPSFEEAKEASRKKKILVPFSRKYAVFGGYRLFHKDREIGSISKDRVEVKTTFSAEFHNRTIGSLTNLVFWAKEVREIDYLKEDF